MNSENNLSILFDENGLTVSSKDFIRVDKSRKYKKMDLDECVEEYISNPSDTCFQAIYLKTFWGLRQQAKNILTYLEMNSDNDILDEITLVVYEKALKSLYQFDAERAKFITWIYTICKNECFAYYNSKKKKTKNEIDNDISEIYASVLAGASDMVEFDSSDKFDVDENGELMMMDREAVKKKFLDTSIYEIKQFKDKRIANCMLERFDCNNAKHKPLNLEEIAKKYDYPFSSVKNWVIKGKNQLRTVMLEKYPELYEMWKETLD